MPLDRHGTLGADMRENSQGAWNRLAALRSASCAEPTVNGMLSSCLVQGPLHHGMQNSTKLMGMTSPCFTGLAALRQQDQDKFTVLTPHGRAFSDGDLDEIYAKSHMAEMRNQVGAQSVGAPMQQIRTQILSSSPMQQDWLCSMSAALVTTPPPGLEHEVRADPPQELEPSVLVDANVKPPPGLERFTLASTDVLQPPEVVTTKNKASGVKPHQKAPTLLENMRCVKINLGHAECEESATQLEPLKIHLGCLSSLSISS